MGVFILFHYVQLFNSFFLTLGLSDLQKENNKILHTWLLLLFQKWKCEFSWGHLGLTKRSTASLRITLQLRRNSASCFRRPRHFQVAILLQGAGTAPLLHSSPHPFKAQIRPVRIWKQGWRQGRAKRGGGVYLGSQRKSKAFSHSPSHSPGP